MTLVVASIIFGYLLGSVPFGLVLVRLAGLGDLRKVGPGTIGATNVLRTGRKDLALLTLILDASKAAIASLVALKLAPATEIIINGNFTTLNIFLSLITGTAAIIGHNFPVWLKFKGGKGVASSFGFILVNTPFIALLALATWIITAIITRYSSLSAIMAAILAPLFTFFFAPPIYLWFYSFIVILLLIRHHTNIKRLINGEETKIKFKKK